MAEIRRSPRMSRLIVSIMQLMQLVLIHVMLTHTITYFAAANDDALSVTIPIIKDLVVINSNLHLDGLSV